MAELHSGLANDTSGTSQATKNTQMIEFSDFTTAWICDFSVHTLPTEWSDLKGYPESSTRVKKLKEVGVSVANMLGYCLVYDFDVNLMKTEIPEVMDCFDTHKNVIVCAMHTWFTNRNSSDFVL
jgi:hypothetical protein